MDMANNKCRIILCSIAIIVFFYTFQGSQAAMVTPHGTQDQDFYVAIYKPDKVWTGTTLFADYHLPDQPRIVEINMEGEILWEYRLPENLKQYINPGLDVELLPNGNILIVLPRKGVFEIQRNGVIVWSYLDTQVDHDADRLPNGNTLVVFGNYDTMGDAQVKEFNIQGETVWAWYARDAFNKPPYNAISFEGWTHTNAVSRLPNGNTLISLRNFDLTVEVDAGGSVITSYDWSPFNVTLPGITNQCPGACPHDPEILSNGNLLVAFPSIPFRVIEIDTKTMKSVWQFSPVGGQTGLIRDADRLPNGNTLITGGKELLEVTPDGEIVWEFGVKGIGSGFENLRFMIYKSERIGHMEPILSIISPENERIYQPSPIQVIINYSIVDLDSIVYRIYKEDTKEWITPNLTYTQTTGDGMRINKEDEVGAQKITLNQGDYMLYVWAKSTGWGDENLLERKVVITEERRIHFTVSPDAPTISSQPGDAVKSTTAQKSPLVYAPIISLLLSLYAIARRRY